MAAFVDTTVLTVKSGRGGDGCVSFCREKYRPLGGPDGGNGGDGGSARVVVKENLHTLGHLRYRRTIRASDGVSGRGARRHGKRGADALIEVPPGTLVRRVSDNGVVCDLNARVREFLLLTGGKGGRGNATYKSSRTQRPRYAERGHGGCEERYLFELRLIADVAFVGFPNVGKSSVLRALSAARPKVAAYPFTSLIPTLGVWREGERSPITIADIPGIVVGASSGTGLGVQFLRHIYRVKIIAVVVALAQRQRALQQYRALIHEVGRYDSTLLQRPRVVVANMLDLPAAEAEYSELRGALSDETVVGCSATAGSGVANTGRTLWALCDTLSNKPLVFPAQRAVGVD